VFCRLHLLFRLLRRIHRNVRLGGRQNPLRVTVGSRRSGVITALREVDDSDTGGQVDPQIAVPGVAFFLAPVGFGLSFFDLVTHPGIEQRA
jgi:hypothetical protein